MIDIDNILKILKAFANERDNLINERDNLIKKNSSIRKRLQEAQSYKADAERYIWICANYDDFTLIQHDYEGSEIECMIDQAINESKPTNPQPKCMENE